MPYIPLSENVYSEITGVNSKKLATNNKIRTIIIQMGGLLAKLCEKMKAKATTKKQEKTNSYEYIP